MAPSPRSARVQELSGTAAAALIAAFGAAGWLGYVWGGLGGAFFGAVGVTALVGTTLVVLRLRAVDRTRLGSELPDLGSLPPAQALSIMGAMVADAGAAVPFRSELLKRLEALDDDVTHRPRQALEQLKPFVEEHPRSPAVHVRVARCHHGLDEPEAAADALTRALRRALDGGMNPMAAQIFAEFDGLRDRLELGAQHLETLGRVLGQRGREDDAAWCAARAEAANKTAS